MVILPCFSPSAHSSLPRRRRNPKLRKSLISSPSNFTHLSHVGRDVKTSAVDLAGQVKYALKRQATALSPRSQAHFEANFPVYNDLPLPPAPPTPEKSKREIPEQFMQRPVSQQPIRRKAPPPVTQSVIKGSPRIPSGQLQEVKPLRIVKKEVQEEERVMSDTARVRWDGALKDITEALKMA